MAKTLKKIARPTMAGLREALQEYKDGYEAERNNVNVKALEARNAELVKWREEARDRAAYWQGEANDRAIKINELERKIQGLQGTVQMQSERLALAQANIERLQGWIDCKQGRDPRIETEIPF